MPTPVPDLADPTLAGIQNPSSGDKRQTNDAASANASRPKGEPSDAVTMAPRAVSQSAGSSPPHPIFSHIGATIFHEGDVLGGRYEILKMLGMGGMGAVYKARDMEVERIVALKVIRPDLAGNPAILARFKQELVLARQVTHKNIIRIYDLNEADGVKFITMEFIEGEDLRSILTRQGKLSPEEAVGIMLQVCAGLASGACRRRDPSRSEAQQHHARRRRTRSHHGLRPGADHRRRWYDADRHDGRARWSTCRRNRRWARIWTRALTSSLPG